MSHPASNRGVHPVCKKYLEKCLNRPHTVGMLKRRPLAPPNAERFWAKVDKSKPPCWPWTGPRDPAGYGYYGRYGLAHRIAHELTKGRVPDGLEIDHLCRNRGCVNPDHLEAVTHRENLLRGHGPAAINAAKTHCKRGHLFDEKNTIVSDVGWRACRICSRMHLKNWEKRNPEKVRLYGLKRAERYVARQKAVVAGIPVPDWATKRCEEWGQKPKEWAPLSREERRAMWAARCQKVAVPS